MKKKLILIILFIFLSFLFIVFLVFFVILYCWWACEVGWWVWWADQRWVKICEYVCWLACLKVCQKTLYDFDCFWHTHSQKLFHKLFFTFCFIRLLLSINFLSLSSSCSLLVEELYMFNLCYNNKHYCELLKCQ